MKCAVRVGLASAPALLVAHSSSLIEVSSLSALEMERSRQANSLQESWSFDHPFSREIREGIEPILG